MKIVVRKAEVKDARDIVIVNTYTWATTYKNLIPSKILNDKLSRIDKVVPNMKRIIEEKNNIFVATVDDKVVGFITYGKSNNDNYPNAGEIYALYVLKEYQKIGLGKKLLLKGIEELINLNYQDMILNVLKGNKNIDFYEKFGGKQIDIKEEYLDDTLLVEYVMYFENLSKIYCGYNNKK